MHENTFHDFTGDADRHWDYIFWKERNFRGSDMKIQLKKAIVPKKDSTINLRKHKYISDHYPIIAEFEIESKNKNEELISEDNEKKDFSELDEFNKLTKE